MRSVRARIWIEPTVMPGRSPVLRESLDVVCTGMKSCSITCTLHDSFRV